jgi:hypothetical protein
MNFEGELHQMTPSYSLSASGLSRNPIPWLKTLAVALIGSMLAVPASAQHGVQSQPPSHVVTPASTSPTVHDWPTAQTPDLIALRVASSPAEKKLSFNLLLLTRKNRKAPLTPIDSMLDSSVLNSDGSVNVDIVAYLSPSLMASPVMENVVRSNGGSIPLPAYISDHFQAKVYPAQLLDLAANPNVLAIRDMSNANMASNAHSPAIPVSR